MTDGIKLAGLRVLFIVICLLMPGEKLICGDFKEIDEFLKTCQSYRLFNGSALVAEQGRVILSRGYGPADREWQIPNSIDTKFKLGSITKSFTAGLILKLAEKKLLRLDDPLSKHLPDYPKDKGGRILIHHLLCHSTGIPNLAHHYPNWFSELWLKDYTTSDFIALFKDLVLEFEPGSRFAYSNAGYFLLAVIIERITGKPYGEIVDEMIFLPLGMKNSGHFDGYAVLPKMAQGYEYWNFDFLKTGYCSASIHKGDGGIFSTVMDLYKWSRSLDSDLFLSSGSRELMFTGHMFLRPGRHYGYGWVVGEMILPGSEEKIHFMEHSGSDLGFNNVLFRIPEKDVTIILLSNTSQSRIDLVKSGLLEILFNGRPKIARPLSLALSECRTLSQLNSVLENFRKSGREYIIQNDELNGLGLQFSHSGAHELGLAVLEFNAEEFPDSAWTHECLSKAYLAAGLLQKAVFALKRILELDPNYDWAKMKLSDLEAKRK